MTTYSPPGAKLLTPEGAEHLRRTIDGIFELLGQIATEIEDLKRRVDDIERRGTADPPGDGREYRFDQESGQWFPRSPRM